MKLLLRCCKVLLLLLRSDVNVAKGAASLFCPFLSFFEYMSLALSVEAVVSIPLNLLHLCFGHLLTGNFGVKFVFVNKEVVKTFTWLMKGAFLQPL
jgi:hypothetical protein